MATITDFEEWLDENVDGTDYIDVYSVYCTVNEGMGQGGFEIKKKPEQWQVVCNWSWRKYFDDSLR